MDDRVSLARRGTPPAVDTRADRAPASSLLAVDDLSVSFRTRSGTVHALDRVSLDIGPGDVLGIVGESGSGKSVLAKSIMSLLPPHAVTAAESTIAFEGQPYSTMSRQERKHFRGVKVAMVFQDPMTALTPVLRIGDQITEPLRYHLGLGRAEARHRATGLLRQVGLPDPAGLLRRYPHSLSGGMRQRVLIAIALGCSPRLLIADEPTTALDVTVQQQILNLLAGIQRDQGMATILISHDLAVVSGRTERIAVMYAGRVVEMGGTSRLLDQSRHHYTRALLAARPSLHAEPHRRLEAIPGRPPSILSRPTGCAFAPRCRAAQPRCITESPALTSEADPLHRFACFYPAGTDAGDGAVRRNRSTGETAAGLRLERGDD
jgi:peptide/nickel transport system ATP-binding protein